MAHGFKINSGHRKSGQSFGNAPHHSAAAQHDDFVLLNRVVADFDPPDPAVGFCISWKILLVEKI